MVENTREAEKLKRKCERKREITEKKKEKQCKLKKV